MGAPIQIDFVPSWYTRLRTRIFTQFRDAVTWDQWATLLGKQFDDLEVSAQSMFGIFDIANSSGAQLDFIGRVVGQPRASSDDPTYRLYLYARVAADKSTGTPENIYKVMRTLYGSAVSMIVNTSVLGVKTFAVHINTVLTRAQALAGASFLSLAKEAAARALFEWQEAPSAALFTYDGTSVQGYDNGVYAGAIQA